MAKHFTGNYSSECRFFKNNNLRLGNGYLMKTLDEMGIGGLYFYRRLWQPYSQPYSKPQKHYRYIEARPKELPRGSKGLFSSIEEGTIRVPEAAVRYADLRKGKVSVIGMKYHLELWNMDKIEEICKDPLTREDFERIAESFARK